MYKVFPLFYPTLVFLKNIRGLTETMYNFSFNPSKMKVVQSRNQCLSVAMTKLSKSMGILPFFNPSWALTPSRAGILEPVALNKLYAE